MAFTCKASNTIQEYWAKHCSLNFWITVTVIGVGSGAPRGRPKPPHFPVSFWNFELWILNNYIGTVFFYAFVSLDRAGGSALPDPAIDGPMFCPDWDDVADPSLVCEKHTYRQHSLGFVPARTSRYRSERKRELKQADRERGGHTFLTGVARNKIRSNKILTGFRVPLLHECTWNRHADGHPSPCVWSWSEICYFTMPKLKRRLPSDFLGRKKVPEAISEHQISKMWVRGHVFRRYPREAVK